MNLFELSINIYYIILCNLNERKLRCTEKIIFNHIFYLLFIYLIIFYIQTDK